MITNLLYGDWKMFLPHLPNINPLIETVQEYDQALNLGGIVLV